MGFFAGFAFALAIATPPSFTYAPDSYAKIGEVGHLPPGDSRDLCSFVDGPAPPTSPALSSRPYADTRRLVRGRS